MALKHCNIEFIKQVLPRFRSPEMPNLCPMGVVGNTKGCWPRINTRLSNTLDVSILSGLGGRGGDGFLSSLLLVK